VGIAIVAGMCMQPVDLSAVQATPEKPATDSYRKLEVTDRDVQGLEARTGQRNQSGRECV